MDKLQLKAYGKINLGLDVIRKRPMATMIWI